MKYVFLLGLMMLLLMGTDAQETKVSTGKIISYPNFASHYVLARNVEVWLPDGYSSAKKYAVIYMHDGQMLFDTTHNWAHKEWGVDETVGRLIKEKRIKECIVVGIWNSGKERHTDYFPQNPFEALTPYQQDTLYKANRPNSVQVFAGKVHSDNYLRFLVTELKPFIDSNFSVYTDRAHTFIAGSSMGGLISMYAICEYPNIFGGAACLSTHWPGIFTNANNPIPDAFMSYLKKHLAAPATHKLYFDYGTKTLDTLYEKHQKRADAIIKAGGYDKANFMTRKFEGASHTEDSWAKRLSIPILFLLETDIRDRKNFNF